MMSQRLDIDAAASIADNWLLSFSRALSNGAVDDVVGAFQPDGWLKDSLVFSWTSRSLHGHALIREYLASSAQSTLAKACISNVQLDRTTKGLAPEFIPLSGKIGGTAVGFAFTFEAPAFYGKAFALLRKHETESNWKAIFVFMRMEEIKGNPPSPPESGVYEGHTLSWEEVWDERKSKIEADPYVLIVGAGQTGLNMGARLKNMNIPTIIIDKLPRVGDQWRSRYPTLALHTPRTHHSSKGCLSLRPPCCLFPLNTSVLFQPYPRTWPIFTPRDKVADWLEQFPKSQDLIVWNNTTIKSSIKPTFDGETKRWELTVNRDGKDVVLRPAHIIVATGVLGSPRIPVVKDESLFTGSVLHASKFKGGKYYKGKRVLVVGAGNTGADIAQDCVMRSAQQVTLLQRSSTCTISAKTLAEAMAVAFPEGEDLEVSDFKYQAYPIGLQRQWAIEDREEREKKDEDLHRKLINKGVRLNQGRDGSGQHLLIFERWGGIDVGIADLIDSGKVKIRNGVELVRFLPDGVVFTDGSKLEVDVVIYATGYHSSREDLKPIFGQDVISRLSKLQVDKEDEVNLYRPSGLPGVWFAGGDFAMGRALSKQLGLQIQARLLGLVADESLQHTPKSRL